MTESVLLSRQHYQVSQEQGLGSHENLGLKCLPHPLQEDEKWDEWTLTTVARQHKEPPQTRPGERGNETTRDSLEKCRKGGCQVPRGVLQELPPPSAFRAGERSLFLRGRWLRPKGEDICL